jgi:adenylyl cyclase CyaB, putative
MQEIEMKFKIDNVEIIKKKLKQLGCKLSKELNQKDTVFVPDINDTSTGKGKMFIRIRNANGTNELTLKKRSNSTIESKEIEFEVSSFDKAYEFLDTLGLVEWVTVEKKRITTNYKKFNICIDEVNRLGNFIEIEIVTEEENRTSFYEQEIMEIAKELGIEIKSRINNFYDTMIRELDNK